MFKTIRTRLTLSFAAIALVAAVALGAVLLVILQGYYQELELNYLQGNAQAISGVVMKMMAVDATHEEVQSQIENLGFLTQTRIQIISPYKQLLYDSGSPRNLKVNLGVMRQLLTENNGELPKSGVGIISVGGQTDPEAGPLPPVKSQTNIPDDGSAPAPGTRNVMIYRSVQAAGSPFGFYLSAEAMPVDAPRSNLTITLPVPDPHEAGMPDYLVLTEGPAYGSAILASVAEGWAFASALAVLLAALIGWFISRRISAPVLALTGVTTRMAGGDLSSRANVEYGDEFGQLAQSFNEMAGQVETTITTLRTFVSDAAHEINTPLTALKTNLELAINEQDAGERAEFLSRAIKQNERLEHLANELLDLSRIESSHMAQDPELFDLRELTASVAERFASRAEQSGRAFNLDLPAGMLRLRGNKSQVQRAVENLLENALKFTQPGGTIDVQLASAGQEAILTIADTGIGINPEDLGHLFQRFHRGRNAAAYAGNGLGLAIVKAIVRAHEGQVDVQSAGERQGSRFSIRLPV